MAKSILDWRVIHRRAWGILRNKDTTIICGRLRGEVANSYSRSGTKGIKITVDSYGCDVAKAVTHEILHALLDPIWEDKLPYAIFELLINALEQPFLDSMSKQQKYRWRKAIEAKLPESQRLRPIPNVD